MSAGGFEEPDLLEPELLDDADRAQVLALLHRAQDADGVAPLSEEHLLALRDPATSVLVVRDDGGAVVGLASRSGEAVEVAVDPRHRRRGAGGCLVRSVLARNPSLGLWAHGDLPAARALAATVGLVRERDLLRLERAVRPEDAALTRAPGVVALAELDDAATGLAAWLELNRTAFADHPEQGRWTADDVAARVAQPWFDPSLLLLLPDATAAAADDDAAGPLAASLWIKQETPELAEIYVVAVHPDRAGRGLGRAVLETALGEIARRGASTVELYVDGGNTAAVRLYERAGFAVVERHGQYRLPSAGRR